MVFELVEVWKSIEGYEGIYEISDLGRVKSLARTWISGNGGVQKTEDKILKTNNVHGYSYVQLSKDGKIGSKRVHRLVAEAFVPNPKYKTQVNHKNGIKNDNRAINLEWVTPRENTIHSRTTGLKMDRLGQESHKSKLTEEQVIEIRNLYSKGNHTQKALADKFDISRGAIEAIIKRKTWRHI